MRRLRLWKLRQQKRLKPRSLQNWRRVHCCLSRNLLRLTLRYRCTSRRPRKVLQRKSRLRRPKVSLLRSRLSSRFGGPQGDPIADHIGRVVRNACSRKKR